MSELQMLPAWLDAGGAALAGDVPPAPTLDSALPGLALARALAPLQRLQRLRESGMAECGAAGEPIHIAWRQFLRGHGPSVLVIDATTFDAQERGTAAVLDGAPWQLAEGVLIAAGLRDSRKVELLLPAELTGREAAFLNTVDAIRSLAQITTPRMQVEVQRNCRRSCWAEANAADRSRLIHTPETWCRIALLFAGAADLDGSLLTLRRGMKQRGLVELGRSGNLRSQIEQLGGRRRSGRPGRRARFRRRSGWLPAVLQDERFMRATLICIHGHRPCAIQPYGDGRGRVRRQTDPARTLSPLAAGRRRRGAGARFAGARRASRGRDHPRPR